MVANRKLKIYLESDVRTHNTPKDCWVIYNNSVYNVTRFLEDHPGGDDLILEYGGKDITQVLADKDSHVHSDAAYSILDEFLIGRLGNEETITDVNFEYTDSFQPSETLIEDDYQRNQFLDLKRALIPQLFVSNFSKAFYLQQVHQPRYLPEPAILIGPWYLEMFTRTPWYVIPMIWGPITVAFLLYSIKQQIDLNFAPGQIAFQTLLGFLFGNFIWTVLEYVMHRFVFHIDDYLPDHPYALTVHFLLHGIHHYIPMDRMRLVMPPVLFAALSFPFLHLAHWVLRAPWLANATIAGSYAFYILYDTFHYAMHHTQLPNMIRDQKVWHMHHHYKEPNLGFGVTSPIWDKVFGTTYTR